MAYINYLELNPESEDSILGLGRAYLLVNNKEKADEQLKILKEKKSKLASYLEKEINPKK